MAKHVLIIGAGVIGLSSAYYCLRRGMKVTILERASAQRNGCSFGNAGMIVPSHFVPLAAPGMVGLGLRMMWNPESPFYIKPRPRWDLLSWCYRFWRSANHGQVQRAGPLLRDLHLASRDCYEEWAKASNNAIGLQRQGLLMLCKTQHVLDEEAKTAARARSLGIPAEVVDRTRLAVLEPEVTMDVVGAVYFPMDCHLSPNRLMTWLEDEVKRLGGAIEWQADVKEWRKHGEHIDGVLTSRGDFHADEFVLCGGSWSASVVGDLGLRLPLQAGKGYSVTLATPRQLPKICSILTEARVAVTPMGQALRFGGTMEIAGLNEDISPRRVLGIIKSIPQYYPAFREEDFADLQPWCGLRPCSPDGLPYLGRSKSANNLVIATGHAMMGVSLGPITGQIVADLVSMEKPAIDISLLSPDRFG